MVRPDFLPVTVMLISRYRESLSLRASFRAGICTPGPTISLKLLACRPLQDLVYVNVLRLCHGECDCPRERVGGNGKLVDLADVLGDIWLGHAVREFGVDRAR